MNNSELSYKLKYILRELGMNKKEFLEACHMFNSSLSKPTILNAINGTNKKSPTIETLSTIIKVCQTSNNKKLQTISYDFLLNDHIKEIEAKNASVYQSIGLSDDVINRLKEFNHPIYFDDGNIINYFFTYTGELHWRYLKYLKSTCNIKKELKKKDIDIVSILKLFEIDDGGYRSYLAVYFRSVYDFYLEIKNKKEVTDTKKLLDLLEIVINNLKYELLEINKRLYENMEL